MAEKEKAGEEEAVGQGGGFVPVCSAIGPVTATELPADWPAAGLLLIGRMGYMRLLHSCSEELRLL